MFSCGDLYCWEFPMFSRVRSKSRCRLAPLLIFLSTLLMAFVPASAQNPTQQYVYGVTYSRTISGATPTPILGFSKNSQTGALTPIPGAPFPSRGEGGSMAVDGQGKFLFAINRYSNNIAMFQIDQSTGALSEVPLSPFTAPPAMPNTTPPFSLVTITGEASGKFLFAGYGCINASCTASALAMFSIDTSGSSPLLSPISVTSIPNSPNSLVGEPLTLLTNPRGQYLYVGTGHNQATGGAYVYSIQAPNMLTYQGTAALPNGGGALFEGVGYAIDPLDRFFYGLYADSGTEYFVPCLISPANGTGVNCAANPQYLGFTGSTPFIENSGHFLYVPDNLAEVVYSIDQNSGSLTRISGIPINSGIYVADPLGPFLYGTDDVSVYAYRVDASSGNLTEVPGSPFSVGSDLACCLTMAITGSLPVPSPGAALSPALAVAFNAIVGENSLTQPVSLTNNGTQTLELTSISITGANASSFSETNTCAPTLAINASCEIEITFNPVTAGSFTASLQIVDNAASSPQSLALSAIAAAPEPSASLFPNALVFTILTPVGTTSSPLPVRVTSTGTGPLHVTSVSFSGSNPNDFSQTNTCVGSPVTVGSNCTVNISFTPLAVGTITATVVVTDDAPGGSQSASVEATAVAPLQLGPSSPTSGTDATITAGQTAQYHLQLTPAQGFTGAVTLACSGAPTLSTCTVSPNSFNITNATSVPFSVSVSTSGSSSAATLLQISPIRRIPMDVKGELYTGLAVSLVFVLLFHPRDARDFVRRLSDCSLRLVLGFSLIATGCGGGSPSAPLITPRGTYTLTVTASRGNQQLSTLNLTLTVD